MLFLIDSFIIRKEKANFATTLHVLKHQIES